MMMMMVMTMVMVMVMIMKEMMMMEAIRTLNYIAYLCEVRGDWDMWKNIFRFPAHNERAGCCWRCHATPEDIRDVGQTAGWTSPMHTWWQLLSRMISAGIPLNLLFSLPGFTNEICKIDWLHIADKGVAAD
eukprot:10118414-Karenia_brevis.AAC.1